MFEGKEIVEIGRFDDDEIISIEPAQKINNNSKFVYEKGEGKIDFKIRFVDEDVKQKENQK